MNEKSNSLWHPMLDLSKSRKTPQAGDYGEKNPRVF